MYDKHLRRVNFFPSYFVGLTETAGSQEAGRAAMERRSRVEKESHRKETRTFSYM